MKKLAVTLIVIIALGGMFFLIPRIRSDFSVRNDLQVSASFYPLYYFASEIVGDEATVYNITPAGSEPHDYDLTSGDRVKIESSKLLILNGGKLEPWGEDIDRLLSNSQTKVIKVGQADPAKDPHVWLDPRTAGEQVSKIEAALSEIDPGNSENYESRAGDLKTRLEQLDQKYREGLANCEKKEIVTSHTSFAYLAERYGLRQIAITGISPDEEPSPGAMAQIVNFVRENKVDYIFFESLVSPNLAETIATEAGVDTLVLNPVEGLNDDETKKGENYFTIMEKNLNNLRTALKCQ